MLQSTVAGLVHGLGDFRRLLGFQVGLDYVAVMLFGNIGQEGRC
jgi:hypothetical protein